MFYWYERCPARSGAEAGVHCSSPVKTKNQPISETQDHSMKRISIKSAILVGTIWVNIPVLLLLVGPSVFWLIFLSPNSTHPATLRELGMSFALLISGCWIGWMWLSLMISRWRVWAWRRVDDMRGLLLKAVRAGLIWSKGHLFERTEFRPTAIRKEIEILEEMDIQTEAAAAQSSSHVGRKRS